MRHNHHQTVMGILEWSITIAPIATILITGAAGAVKKRRRKK